MPPEWSERNERFDRLAAAVGHTARQGMVLEHRLEENFFQTLQWTVRAYVSASLSSQGTVLSESEIIQRLSDEKNPLLNQTANGVLVPKYEFSMEYNSLHRCLAQMMESLGLEGITDSWQLPVIVRAVEGKPRDPKTWLRPYATTKIHSNVWAGEPSDLVLLNLPVLGDIENTTIRWFQPPAEAGEKFLRTLNDFGEGDAVVRESLPLDLTPKLGHLYFSDAWVLQQTQQNGGGPRVSIDLRVRLKSSPQEKKRAQWEARSKCLEQYVPWQTWRRVGRHAIVVFEDTFAALQQNSSPSFSGKYLLFDFGR